MVRQDGEVVVNETVAKETMDNRTVNVRNIVNIPIITCMYTYTFELTPVYGKFSSGEQHGNPNLRGMCSLLIFRDQTCIAILQIYELIVIIRDLEQPLRKVYMYPILIPNSAGCILDDAGYAMGHPVM